VVGSTVAAAPVQESNYHIVTFQFQ
jgi:hypothetical protein